MHLVRQSIARALPLATALLISTCAAASPIYSLDVDIDWDAGTFAGTLDLAFGNDADEPLDRIALNLFANDATLYGAASLVVLDAFVDGVPIPLPPEQTDSTRLPIALPIPLTAGQTASLVTHFVGRTAPSPDESGPGESGYGILTKNRDSLVLTAFYPILAVERAPSGEGSCGIGDRLWSEAADYAVTVRADASLVPASTGDLIASERSDGLATHVFEATSARDFSLVLTRGFEEAVLQSGSKTLRSHFPSDQRDASERALLLAVQSWELYESRIAPLPFEEIEIVSVPLQRVAGVEFTGLILVSTSYAQRPNDLIYDIILSHEMAHQWFYAAVGNDPTAEPWLDESLATFLSNIHLETYRGSTSALSERARWARTYGAAQRATPELSVGDSSCAFPSSSAYSSFVYDGGALLLQTIRTEIGDPSFFDGLTSYYEAHTGDIGTSASLFEHLEQASDSVLDATLGSFGFTQH